MSLPNAGCTREMFLGELYEGKEALEYRQTALWSFAQMMHNLFWHISRDDSYTYEQKIDILKADAAMIDLITGGKPNFSHCQLSLNAAAQAVEFIKPGDKEKALDMLEDAYDHAASYEDRPDGERFAPCWFSELDDKREYVSRSGSDTVYDRVYDIITKPENQFCVILDGNEHFRRLVDKLKGAISK